MWRGVASVSDAMLSHCCSMVLGGGAGVKEVSIVWKAPAMSSQSAMFVLVPLHQDC